MLPVDMLTHLEKKIDENSLGAQGENGCVYEDSKGNNCGIGTFLPRKMLDKIKNESMNAWAYAEIGDDITDMFSFGICEQLTSRIQNAHDANVKNLPRMKFVFRDVIGEFMSEEAEDAILEKTSWKRGNGYDY